MGLGKRNYWPLAVVLVATMAGMGRLCAAEFSSWDDGQTLYLNPRMNPPSWAGVGYYWGHAYMGLYAPVTYTVWSGLARVASVPADDLGVALNPWVFHAGNVLLHLVNVVLVYRVLTLLVGRPWAAAAGAVVFGVHPVQVEAVGWVSGMKDLLCGTFVLGAVWQYVVFVKKTRATLPRGRVHYWVGAALMVLGMLSKPTAMVTPAIVGVLDWLVLGREWRRAGASAGGYFALVLPCLVWTKVSQTVLALAPIWARPLIAGDAVAFYLWKLVWPAGLTIDYGRSPARVMSHSWWWVTCLVPVAVAAGLWAGRRRAPVLVAGGIVFVVGVAPVLGFTPFMFQFYSTVADHYLYLPFLGVALGTAWVVGRYPTRWMAGVIGVVAVVLTVRSAAQAGVWRDDVALFEHTLEVNPGSSSAHEHLGSEAELRASKDPANREAYLALAGAHFREAVRLRPGTFITQYNLALLLVKQGKTGEAIGPLTEAIRYYEGTADAPEMLARAHRVLGASLWQAGRREEGLAHFKRAVECWPGSPEMRETYDAAVRSLRVGPTTTRRAAGG